jgi:hypothetical protein
LINLVAWGGIEPPTQGFSIVRKPKKSKEFSVFWTFCPARGEPGSDSFCDFGVYGDCSFPKEAQHNGHTEWRFAAT